MDQRTMTNLDHLVPTPRLVEVSSVELDAPPSVVWQFVRHGNLGESPVVRALFALRTLPSRISGQSHEQEVQLCLDDFRSTPERPGFQVLCEQAPHSISVGAIGKVWQLDIPFHHVESAEAYAAFDEPGWIQVAWEVRVEPCGESGSLLDFEVRVTATDDESWERFRRYWRIVGPGSHFVRRVVLSDLRRRFGAPGQHDEQRALPGDELLDAALTQLTQCVTLRATPAQTWPWLVQMGCRRAGFYSVDVLDNGGQTSAREVHPEWQELAIGQVLPATPDGDDGFEVLALDPEHVLVLGGHFDTQDGHQLPFTAPHPPNYWQVTWAFVLEPLDEVTTRLHVRARAQFSPSEKLHLAWIRPVHSFMQSVQLRHLAARVEGRLHRETVRDVLEGLGGAALIALSFFTPFLRARRNHFGLSEDEARRVFPGDELIAEPHWSWTHAIEVDVPAAQVWPWVVQMGADRAGFYSYQWLENLVGCNLRNAESIHPDWALKPGDGLVLHPKAPPLPVVRVEPERTLVAFAAPDEQARANGRPWAAASWAFVVEPRGARCRLTSRFRTACSPDLQTRFVQGPVLLEPVGFAMDRRMLTGIKERAERASKTNTRSSSA